MHFFPDKLNIQQTQSSQCVDKQKNDGHRLITESMDQTATQTDRRTNKPYIPQNDRIALSLVCLLVGGLSPVSHKGLHQGRTQTSHYLQVTHFTRHHTTDHVFFKLLLSLFFIAYLYSAGTRYGRVTYFILRDHTGTMC